MSFSIITTISKGSPVILINQTVKFKADFEADVDLILWFINNIVVATSNGSSMEFRHIFTEAGHYEVKCKINYKYFSKKIIQVYSTSTDDVVVDDTNIINLRYINRSNSAGPADIITFQKNVATDFDENSVAWQICSLGLEESADVVYDKNLQLGYNDPNVITTVNASAGNKYGLDNGIYYYGPSSSPNELQTLNTNDYSIAIKIYRSEKLLFEVPANEDDNSAFQFRPTIWVGVVSGIEEGDVIGSEVISSVNTEISLLGIKSADIVMVGGGVGPSAVPYSFTLQNIVFA